MPYNTKFYIRNNNFFQVVMVMGQNGAFKKSKMLLLIINTFNY